MTEKVYGPASYFPSIEKKYGQPMQHWFDLLASKADLKHMEQVAWLKEEHAMGHGHANAIVAYLKQQQS
jgi:monomeric isocitrate dehydrogenase